MPFEDFIDTPYRYTGHNPYFAPRSTLKSGFLKADRQSLQAHVDRTLNRGGAGKYRFIVPINHVLLTVLYSPLVKSLSAVDKSRGGVEETDVALWTLVYGGPIGKELRWRLFWMPTYIFVDVGTAVATGREVYGFPKQMCRTEMSGDLNFETSVHAVGLQKFHPLGVGREMDVLNIRRIEARPENELSEDELTNALWSWLAGTLAPVLDKSWIKDLLAPFARMPMVFIKQTPAIENTRRAALQQLTTAHNQTTKLYKTSLIASRYEVDLHNSASFQMTSVLGVQPRSELLFPFFAEMDFVAEAGQVLA